MNRRELLQSVISLWAIQACRPLVFTGNKEETWFYSGLGKTGVAASRFSETRKYEAENVIHSVSYNPGADLKVFLPKSGATAYFQKADGSLIPFAPAAGNYFYGHGTFDLKRDLFYTTQSEISLDGPSEKRKYSKGFIYAHRLTDLKIVDQFPTFGNDPHDVRIVNDEIVVCNGGAGSNVSFIDLPTKKLVRAYPLNDEYLSAGHLEVLDEENFVIVTGAYRELYPCAIYSLNRDTGLKKFPIPQGLDSLFRVQLLSVVSYGSHILATCPHTNSLLVWNRSGNFVGAHKVTKATSLAVSHELGGVIVGTGEGSEPLRLVTFSGNQMTVKSLDWGVRSTGSHALVI